MSFAQLTFCVFYCIHREETHRIHKEETLDSNSCHSGLFHFGFNGRVVLLPCLAAQKAEA